jgi:hypothetical protein
MRATFFDAAALHWSGDADRLTKGPMGLEVQHLSLASVTIVSAQLMCPRSPRSRSVIPQYLKVAAAARTTDQRNHITGTFEFTMRRVRGQH